MSIQFEKDIDLKHLDRVIRARIEYEKADRKLVFAALDVIKTFDKKDITKRIATKVSEELNRRAYLYKEYGLIYLDIERDEFYRTRPAYTRSEFKFTIDNSVFRDPFVRLYLRADDMGLLSYEKTLEANSWAPLMEDRTKKLEEGLDYIPGFVQDFNLALDMLKRIYKRAEKRGLEYYFDVPE